MATWPSIRTSDWEHFKRRPRKLQSKTPFEAGYVQSCALNTQKKWEFEVGWNWLTIADYDTLVTFFDNNQGGSFDWDDPIEGNTYTVKFSDEQGLPLADAIGTGYVKLIGVKLEEE